MSVIVLNRVRWFSSPRQNKETVNNIYFVFKNIWNASCALNVIPMFLLLSLDRRLCWWTISPRVYHPPLLSLDRRLCWWTISPRVYHPPVVSAAITGWYLCWWTISPRGYHPRSQCFYHWVDTSAGELLVPAGIIRPVVSVSITGVITLLVDY